MTTGVDQEPGESARETADELIARPVRDQLDAYNDKDIERFMRCWAENCEYCAFPDVLLAQGAMAVRQRHVQRFREPNLRGHLRARLVVGDIVIDHESVQRTLPDGAATVEVVAIYLVRDGLIAKAWFQQTDAVLLQPRSACVS